VLKTLGRIAELGLEFDIIAPDHGLIFRTGDDVRFILELYREMAQQRPKLQAVIAYETMWSATRKMAYSIGDGLDAENVPYVLIDLGNNHCSAVMNALADGSALILGSPTRNNMPMVNMVGLMAHVRGLRPQNLVGATFGSYGWSGEAPRIMAEELAAMKVEVVGEPVRAFFDPTPDDHKQCHLLGGAVARALRAKIRNFQ
jgi:flavorubredoxin